MASSKVSFWTFGASELILWSSCPNSNKRQLKVQFLHFELPFSNDKMEFSLSLWHKLPIIIKILLFCLLQITCNPSKSSILKTFRFKFPWQILANFGTLLPPFIYTARFKILTSLSPTAFYRTAVADEKYFYHSNCLLLFAQKCPVLQVFPGLRLTCCLVVK